MGTAAARDEELISKIKAGDTQSFDTLIEAYFARTFKQVRRLVPAEDAEDVTQDIFLNLVACIDKFQGRSSFITWFNSIISNRVADYYRKSFRRKSRFVSEDALSDRESSFVPHSDIEIRDIIMRVPEAYREVLFLRFVHDFSFTEIASLLNMTYEAVRSRYRRGVKYAGDKLNLRTLPARSESSESGISAVPREQKLAS